MTDYKVSEELRKTNALLTRIAVALETLATPAWRLASSDAGAALADERLSPPVWTDRG